MEEELTVEGEPVHERIRERFEDGEGAKDAPEKKRISMLEPESSMEYSGLPVSEPLLQLE